MCQYKCILSVLFLKIKYLQIEMEKLGKKSGGGLFSSNKGLTAIAMMAAAESEESKNLALQKIEKLQNENKELKDKVAALEKEKETLLLKIGNDDSGTSA